MSSVSTLEGLAKGVTLDGLRDDDRWLTFVFGCGFVGSVDLLVVVATTTKSPELIVGHGLDHLCCSWVATEEILPYESTRLGFVGLVITIGGSVH